MASTHLSVFEVNLVSQHDKGEVLGVPGTGLDEKLVSPAVKGLERVGGGDVEHQDAAVGASVEGHAQGLEPLLPRRVPNLPKTHRHSWGRSPGRGAADGRATPRLAPQDLGSVWSTLTDSTWVHVPEAQGPKPGS